jgi:hypothetical protein
MQYVQSKGYDLDSEMYAIYSEIMGTFSNYEFTYQYISGSAKEDIESATEPGMHLIIEPIILPSVSSALFIGMYGDLEFYLNLICAAHKNDLKLDIALKDIAGSGIERAATYLSKVVGIGTVKNSSEWNELKHWNRVRNILVHNNGIIRNQDDERSIAFLGLNINPKHNKVYLSITDCEKFERLVVRFTKLCI